MASYARRSKWIISVLVAAVAASTSWAEITPNGDVSPADPSTWDTATEAYIGNTANGSVLVNNGGTLLSDSAYLGFSGSATGAVTIDGPGSTWTIGGGIGVGASGTGTLNITNGGNVNSSVCYLGMWTDSMGTVAVDGTGSTWTIGGDFRVGNSGTGTLNITHGGQVVVTGPTYVAYDSTATGSINFVSAGGTLTTQSIHAANAQITGTGTIDTRGLVSDGDLVFDATHGLNQTLTWINASQNVTIHLDMTGGSGAVGELGAGYQNTGTLTIRDGVAVTSGAGCLGYKNGSAGIATVSGTGSTWTIGGDFRVGLSGTGTLNINNGGKVNTSGDSTVVLGYDAGSAGTVHVDGPGSTWNFTGDLGVGLYGTGALNITNGGQVNSGGVHLGVYAGSSGTMNVDGPGSIWTTTGQLRVGIDGNGVLSITNGGQVSSGFGTLGSDAGTTGTATVDGPNSTWTIGGDFAVALSGTGVLNITNGGKVSSGTGLLGCDAGTTGTVNVDGPGSTWTIDGDFRVGLSGAGVLNITNGGQVSSCGESNIILGELPGATGMVTVDGPGSKWIISGGLSVGYFGTGTLNIPNGGQVTVAGPTRVAQYNWATDSINFGSHGGTLTTGSLWAVSAQFTGTGAINTRGFGQ